MYEQLVCVFVGREGGRVGGASVSIEEPVYIIVNYYFLSLVLRGGS